jgi:uncharacterized protein YjbI with pentapeptide repeats
MRTQILHTRLAKSITEVNISRWSFTQTIRAAVARRRAAFAGPADPYVRRSLLRCCVLGLFLSVPTIAIQNVVTNQSVMASSSGSNPIIKDRIYQGMHELMPGISLENLSFQDQTAINADLRDADLSSSSWSKMVLDGSTFVGANLDHAQFFGGSMVRADFRKAKFSNTKFYSVDLTGANFSGATGNVEFSNTDLVLEGANLTGLNISVSGGCGLCEVNLRGANLTKITLWYGSFARADLTGAILTGATFGNVDWTGVICPNGVRQNTECKVGKAKVKTPLSPKKPVTTVPRTTIPKTTTTSVKTSTTTTAKKVSPPVTVRPRVVTRITSPPTTKAPKARKKPGQCTTWMYGQVEVYWNNGSITVVDGGIKKKCVDGYWRNLDNSGDSSGSSGSSARVIGQECSLEESGMYSSFYGQGYRWRVYDVYSDGRRSMARFGFGSGYENQVPSICW